MAFPENLRQAAARKTAQGSTKAAWCTVSDSDFSETSAYLSFPYFSDVVYNKTKDTVTDEDASGTTKTLQGGAEEFSAEYTMIQQDIDKWIEEELPGNTIRIVQEDRSVPVNGNYIYRVFHATVDENWSKNQKTNERSVNFNAVAAPADVAIDLTCTGLNTAGDFAVTLTEAALTLAETNFSVLHSEAEV